MGAVQPCSAEYLADKSRRLKVCGHPLRLQLLCAIFHTGEPCVSQLWECVGQPQPVVSQHLAVLKENAVVSSEIKGNRRIYTIIDPFIREIVQAIINDEDVLASRRSPVASV
ncbi:ArsR/SmtB family transcription factor [Spirochaeta africana]|uniref:Putative transcriptional regulator n=1 Tax=Spirochaeta africana (strain ATCC 700263 / DSM 8902 / Z-7692) TaxID=889378 RepID=H9UKN5_SPIAZ|nr:metalloregulator ArsR/SmtB family transcription factor [Spirochaeta africana]AFG38078.1 putative transcriptional regulator [Spirochaeta africana DSM 8902]